MPPATDEQATVVVDFPLFHLPYLDDCSQPKKKRMGFFFLILNHRHNCVEQIELEKQCSQQMNVNGSLFYNVKFYIHGCMLLSSILQL